MVGLGENAALPPCPVFLRDDRTLSPGIYVAKHDDGPRVISDDVRGRDNFFSIYPLFALPSGAIWPADLRISRVQCRPIFAVSAVDPRRGERNRFRDFQVGGCVIVSRAALLHVYAARAATRANRRTNVLQISRASASGRSQITAAIARSLRRTARI